MNQIETHFLKYITNLNDNKHSLNVWSLKWKSYGNFKNSLHKKQTNGISKMHLKVSSAMFFIQDGTNYQNNINQSGI